MKEDLSFQNRYNKYDQKLSSLLRLFPQNNHPIQVNFFLKSFKLKAFFTPSNPFSKGS